MSKSLRANVSRPREGKHRASLPLRHLRQNVSGSAKAIETKFLASAGDYERSPADQPCAEQRGERHVFATLTQRESVAGISDRRRRKTAIACVAREERHIAEIFLAATAVRAHATSMTEPRNAHAPTHA